MELIQATEAHIPAIQALSDIVWPVTFKDILSPEQIRYMMDMMYSADSLRKQMTEGNQHYLLVKENGEYLGYLAYEVHYRGRRRTKIHKIYVLPSAQGKGVGRFLMETAEQIAAGSLDTELSLNVNRHNPAIRFYRKIGFRIAGREDIDIGNGFLMEDYVMSKKLDGDGILQSPR